MLMRLRQGINVVKRAGGALTLPEKLVYRWGLSSPESLSLPDFLGIGLPRSGTTWLYKNLVLHPDIYFPSHKELHYFNRHFQRPLRSYARNFEGARPGQKKGEVTPDYAYLHPRRIRFIHALIPQVRLVLLLRNPVERAWSDIVRVLAKRPGRNVEDIAVSHWKNSLNKPKWRSRNDYVRVLKNWSGVFPADQIFVGLYDDISSDPEDVLKAILHHLRVSAPREWHGYPLRDRINRGPGDQMPDEVRHLLEEVCRDQLELLENRLGRRVAHWRTS